MNFAGWLKLVEQIAPIALSVTPLAPIAPFIALGIKTAEQIPGASGADKLALATTIAQSGVAAINAQAGHQEIDPMLVNQAIAQGIGTVVAVVNTVHAAQAEDAAEVPK